MPTLDRYATPIDTTEHHGPQGFEPTFRWEHHEGREKLLNLYQKGKRLQWDAAERIDWSQELGEDNPQGLPDEIIPIFGSDVWNRLTTRERANLRRHFQSWQISQFLHGE